ncbi:hypothetical protein CFP65_6989 [Kitasatospora sp. MMS16-BH015]|uniref:bestrophin-like domain n=1 Tax=Kitasatospora sp. MMS16-BH015 TaxID=2018025 RepID=UPI000CA276F1|nr:DUF4239 domain-containing protein [Kitasatospora sp. MMS16-BH015]AUG81601.1 hypothetical protein CFP65_6989 [Kitasatospora sp. MMS16-BH015]
MSWTDLAILTGSLLLVTLTLHVLQRVSPSGVRMSYNDVAGFIFAVVGVLYAVLLAFVVIVVWQSSETAKDTTFKESNALAGVYWMSRQMPLPQGAVLEGLTVSYAHAVIDTEWPLMRDHQSSPSATALLYQMRDTALGFQPADQRQSVLYDHLVTNMDELAGQRRARLNEITDVVPPLLWAALIIGAVITIGFTFLFGLSNTWVHVVMVLSLTALVCLSLITIRNMSYPFDGVSPVEPTAFQVFLSRLPPAR